MPAKPTIFVFTTAYYPFIGGAEIAVQEVSRRLADEFRFFIITARFRRDLPPREIRPEGAVIRVGFGSSWDKWFLPFLGAAAFFRERRRLGGTAILWGMDISAGAVAAAIVNMCAVRAPFVLTIQYGYGGKRLWKGRLGAIGKAFRWMLKRACAVTAISSYLAEETKHFGYRRPVKLLPNGVALEAFPRRKPSYDKGSPPVVITVGRLVAKNGTDILIRAFAEVRKEIPSALCHIIGDGPERPSLEALAGKLNISPAVIFKGSIPYHEVAQYLARADVFVRPSRSEGMGNAFVEALAAGLPVVGTPVEGILDIIKDGENGFFAAVDSIRDIAEKMVRLLKDPGLRQRLGKNGAAMARERFSWDVIARGYAGVFQRSMLPRILIAAPMLPPDIGGPGTYAGHLAEEFRRRGHAILLLAYGSAAASSAGSGERRISLRLPLLVRLFRYGFAAWQLLRNADIAIALDPVAVGLPLAAACRLRGKPFIIRVEGDALWERYVERSGEEYTLRQFYEWFGRLRLNPRERVWYRMSRWVFQKAKRIIFSSGWRKEIFALGYSVAPRRAAIIASPWPNAGRGASERERVFLFAGRFVRAKNIPRLIRAFLEATAADNRLNSRDRVNFDGPSDSRWRLELIGDGPEGRNLESRIQNLGRRGRVVIRPPLAPGELRQRIASAHAFVLPSLSDVSPNVILECLAMGTPFLLTRETGFYETLKDTGLFVDPRDGEDIAAKLRLLLDPNAYAAYRERIAKFSGEGAWSSVAAEWSALAEEASASGA